ncbi:prosaposin-like protein [Cinnamomum micranthum f. kanehirae]|uniref:Prosaposin-like protein n=1 Tax=Cinnamomum micranthum f. kanehirae TaxID=337451 RepID=A0A3S3M7M5_9MAGN|nr:prosaposin-like protein [Cinnamomum micranthum f. kanehirae]
MDYRQSSSGNSCLSISREVEKVLGDPKLLEKASMTASELCHILPSDLQQKKSDNRSCTACHNALNELLDDLENPKTKIKVLKVLLKACEEVENHVKECKKLVFEYGPLILANVEKIIAKNDLCSIMHVCNSRHQTGKATDV